jgi:hypothetical protein
VKRRSFLQFLMAGLGLLPGCVSRSGDRQGPQECHFCKGKGRHKCDVCDGDGRFKDASGAFEECDICDGSGSVKCPMCKGTGKLEPLPFRNPRRPRRVDS